VFDTIFHSRRFDLGGHIGIFAKKRVAFDIRIGGACKKKQAPPRWRSLNSRVSLIVRKKNYASTAEEQPQQNNDRYRYAQ
jgi:hypothetical protein